MKRLFCLLQIFLWLGFLSTAGVLASPPPLSQTAKATTVPIATKIEWEQKWNTVLANAKKEGVVRLYSTYTPQTRILLGRAFKDKYGIDLEMTNFAIGREIYAKVEAEARAGLRMVDAFGIGTGSLVGIMKANKLLGPIEPMLILPEVTNPEVWKGGNFPFIDKDRFIIEFIAASQRYIIYNKDIIKKGEITTYKDLLKLQYRGKITLGDPTVTGVGNSMFAHLAQDLWNLDEATEFLRKIVKEQKADVQRNRRFQVELIARGKYPIGLAVSADVLAEFLSLGAPIAAVDLKEGYKVTSGGGAIGVPKHPAHPNATIVFINWLLSKEGQEAFIKGFRSPSYRLDVSTAGINPVLITKPGDKIYRESEDEILSRRNLLNVAKKIIGDS